MRRRMMLIVLALGLFSTAASALPTAPITSGNGMLQFSNFQFFSPFSTVNSSDVAVTPLTDGLQFSGNVSTSTDVKSFYVAYDINLTPAATGQGIKRASMQLDSSVDSDTLGLVLATKRLIGDKNTATFFGKTDANAKGTRAMSPGTDAFNDSTSGFDLSGFSRKTVAFLRTADWDAADTKFRPPLGLGGDGAIRMVEAGFANQTHLRVLEHVVVAAESGTATWKSTTEHFITGASAAVVPEPGTASLVLLGLSVVGMSRRRAH